MANTARVTQSFLIDGTLQNGTARVTQSFVIVGVGGLGITCGNPPAGSVGAGYSHQFPAVSGDPPYTYALIAPDLIGTRHRCPIVIQHGQVAADQTGFPVLLTEANLPPEMLVLGGLHSAQADGGDIRFTTDPAGLNRIACEIVIWNQNVNWSASKAEIWCPVDVLAASDVTIYVWYGDGPGKVQPAPGAPFGSQAVWDANYQGVWHVPDGTALSLANSTGIGAPVNHGAIPAQGQIDGAVGVTTTQYADTGLTPAGVTDFTLSAWISEASLPPTEFPISSRDVTGNNGIAFLYEDTPGPEILFLSGGNLSRKVWGSLISRGSFHYVVGTHAARASSMSLYVDGVPGGSTTESAAVNPGNASSLVFGRDGANATPLGFTGQLDEVRFSNTVRSASRVATEFANQSSPSTFSLVGVPVVVAPVLPLPPGLTLDPATGIVSGTPTAGGIYPFTIQVVDSFGAVGQVTCSIAIAVASTFVLLIGWKLYPVAPCEDVLPLLELPPVKRAV